MTDAPAGSYDVVGIGIGPFNLGLAALSAPLDVRSVFLDAAPELRWHPGMLIEGATLQVPFLADLVTMADPTSPYSFLAYLKDRGRLYPFYIREHVHPLRAEVEDYYRWASARLGDGLCWGRAVTEVRPDGADLLVRAEDVGTGVPVTVRARHVVLGIGTRPSVPAVLRGLPGPVVHSSGYLGARDSLRASGSVTVIGSGQSAAEIYRDLLLGAREGGYRVDWVTRSPRFFPMEVTKLTLEMTSPEYTDHFHGLPMVLRDRLTREQRGLYKGISGRLVDDIYDTLYQLSLEGPPPTMLLSDTEVVGARWDEEDAAYTLLLRHAQLGRTHRRRCGALVLATGYEQRSPDILDPLGDRVRRDARGRLAVARDYSVDDRGQVFVQNGEEHTHGLTAPDLGFGAWRNSSILASVLGREVYPVERRIAFQEFGVPDGGLPAEGRRAPAPGKEETSGAGLATTVAPKRSAPDPAAVRIEPVDPGRDAAVVQTWLRHPASSFWQMGHLTTAEVHEYLAGLAGHEHQQPWLGHVHGRATFYLETYDPARVTLTQVHRAHERDVGLHLLVAPPGPGEQVHGLTSAVMAASLRHCFDVLGAERVVVEPDVDNHAIAAKNAAAGFTPVTVVELPGKRALLSVCSREAFTASRLGAACPLDDRRTPALGSVS